MSMSASDIVNYLGTTIAQGNTTAAADAVANIGGALSTIVRTLGVQLTTASKVNLVSDGADVRSWVVKGRLPSGSYVSETGVLNGATPVQTTNTFSSIIELGVGAVDGARTVTITQNTGSVALGSILPNEELQIIMFFMAASSPGGSVVRYEPFYSKNKNGVNSALGITATITADPQSDMGIGFGAYNGTATTTNRTTAPSGVTFVGDSVAVAITGGIGLGNTDLGPGDCVQWWARQTLATNQAAAEGSFTLNYNFATTQ